MSSFVEDAELIQVAREAESDRIERKESFRHGGDDVRKTICAFANDLPGHRAPAYLIIGQHDDRTCAGISVDDALLLNLGGLSAESNFAPAPSIDVRRLRIDNCELAFVIVYPSGNPPVRFRGTTYIRVGPRTQVARPDDERRLNERRTATATSFDMSTPNDASLSDLDIRTIMDEYVTSAIAPEILAQNARTDVERLSGLRLLGRDLTPTIGALLTYGRDALRWVPGAYLQFVRFDGQTSTDPIRDQKRLDGGLAHQLVLLDDLLKINITTELEVDHDLVDRRRPDYPIVALQQLCRNALMHRAYDPGMTNAPTRVYWYDDRVEIQNPGGLYGQMTPENFGTGLTDYRNPLLAEIIATLGFVQRFGFGVQLASQQLEKNGNPKAKFDFDPRYIQVTVLSRVSI